MDKNKIERRWVLPWITDGDEMIAAVMDALTLEYKELPLWQVHCQRRGVNCERFLKHIVKAQANYNECLALDCVIGKSEEGYAYYDVVVENGRIRALQTNRGILY